MNRYRFEAETALADVALVDVIRDDDALDPRVEDATREWLAVAYAAVHVVIGALQEKVKAAV